MEKNSISFNDLPAAVSYLIEKIDRVESLLEKQQQAPAPEPTSKWMDVKELQAFLPDHPAAPTVYGWIRNGLIPYYKKGKKLSVRKKSVKPLVSLPKYMMLGNEFFMIKWASGI